ncbi:MORN repeat-containing protein [Toxoplasma gondii ME49]|uniref:MORN repeat-containing protein n=4 Tax=Toxoplasma gondii TaxID=5811 RepID=B6KK13_TOXGV|nr:MORN repeat-containing protein [Toxoplasma gondii ME49]ESS35858.1 MORN repeat-containing protein [Toxoplasma gondii VEG]KYF46300.1 MORN repeat-containing protein [Toxoplasma gondii ARI]PIM04146.1 MORN repeat-containing protein [Toxoplasma gondii COUG]EPT28783.1 MORN repeat-containing protein [Toxoplasma gondii ME49]CEL74990.1 TPA: MORN repeat-containing protein [Toxoplasma gondii VEG]|eukprot:XP_002368186.1 MORN repeat-containing protein [Toxoplasma gondii ME49]
MAEAVPVPSHLDSNGEITARPSEGLPCGTIKFPDGGTYVGEYKLVERNKNLEYTYHGKGSYTRGSYSCSGVWRDGQFARGTIKFESGDSFDGQVFNGLFHGWGRYTWANGEQSYEGTWRHGLMSGTGTLRIKASVPLRVHPEEVSEASNTPWPTHQIVTGCFHHGRLHEAPGVQMAMQEEFTNQYVAEWRETAIHSLRDMEAALRQGLDISGYLAGSGSGSPGTVSSSSGGEPSKGIMKPTSAGSASVETDSRAKGMKKTSARTTVRSISGKQVSSINAGCDANPRIWLPSSDFAAETFVAPPYPQVSDFHADGISRLVGLLCADVGGTPAMACEIRVPLADAELSQLVTVDPSRVRNEGRKFGCGSGQIVEVTARMDGSGSLLASIALLNCNHLTSVSAAAYFRVIGLSLLSPQQLRRLK